MCAADTRRDEERHLAAAELNVRVVCLYVSRSRCARKQKQRWIISFRLQMCLLRCVKCHRPNSINLPRKHLRTLHHEAPASLWCQNATQTRLSSPTSITGCKRVVIDEALNPLCSLVCVYVDADWWSVLLGDQEVGSPRPQAGDGVVWFPRRRLSVASPAADGGGDAAAEAGLHLQRLAVRWPGPERAC